MMDETMNRSRGGSRLKIFAGLVALAFAVTLAVIVGNRLSDEALAVLAGAVCGVGAAIPTSATSDGYSHPRRRVLIRRWSWSHRRASSSGPTTGTRSPPRWPRRCSDSLRWWVGHQVMRR